MAGILYASGLSLSRCHCRQATAGTPAGTALINQHAERVGADMDAGRRDERGNWIEGEVVPDED